MERTPTDVRVRSSKMAEDWVRQEARCHAPLGTTGLRRLLREMCSSTRGSSSTSSPASQLRESQAEQEQREIRRSPTFARITTTSPPQPEGHVNSFILRRSRSLRPSVELSDHETNILSRWEQVPRSIIDRRITALLIAIRCLTNYIVVLTTMELRWRSRHDQWRTRLATVKALNVAWANTAVPKRPRH